MTTKQLFHQLLEGHKAAEARRQAAEARQQASNEALQQALLHLTRCMVGLAQVQSSPVFTGFEEPATEDADDAPVNAATTEVPGASVAVSQDTHSPPRHRPDSRQGVVPTPAVATHASAAATAVDATVADAVATNPRLVAATPGGAAGAVAASATKANHGDPTRVHQASSTTSATTARQAERATKATARAKQAVRATPVVRTTHQAIRATHITDDYVDVPVYDSNTNVKNENSHVSPPRRSRRRITYTRGYRVTHARCAPALSQALTQAPPRRSRRRVTAAGVPFQRLRRRPLKRSLGHPHWCPLARLQRHPLKPPPHGHPTSVPLIPQPHFVHS